MIPPGLEAATDEPATPTDVDLATLPRAVRAQLKSLPPELAATVGAHLVMAGDVIDSDPQLALAHTLAARRRAARLAVVREATAEAAYAAGDWNVALREFRAVRRMRGDDEVLPVIADCERALGRPREALEIAAGSRSADLSLEQRIEMTLVEAGARADLGQVDEALRLLRGTLGDRSVPALPRSRVMAAYADLLWASGQHDQARTWFGRSAELDPEGAAGDRLAELEGRPLPSDEASEWGVLEVEFAPEEVEEASETRDGGSGDEDPEAHG